MTETEDFFNNYLPNKLSENPDIAKDINAIYVFDIDGAGQWTVDLTADGGTIAQGSHAEPGCTVTATQDNFEKMLDNPSSAMMMYMSGKLKVSNMGLGLSLQKLLG